MTCIHLAQIFYNPSYYDPPVDYLEEPSFLPEIDTATPMGKLRSVDQIQSFLLDLKSSYIEYSRKKITDIANWSGGRGAHLLAFPEYAIPLRILPDLQEISRRYSMIVVAGTHRVSSGEEAKTIYQSLGLILDSGSLGCAISPIFLPDGSVQIAKKLRKSKWEPNLATSPHEDPKVITVQCREESVRLSVIPCIDCLYSEVLGKLWKSNDGPNLIVCPSLSPSTDLFKIVGSFAALQETLFSYVNEASFGGTSFCLPTHWQPFLSGSPHTTGQLADGLEAIFELNIDLQNLFSKRGSVRTTPICSHPFSFPIIYSNRADWLSKFLEHRKDLIEWLNNSEKEMAIEWLDSYLTEEGSNLPDIVMQNLKCVRHSLLPLYDGNIDSIKMHTELIKIAETVEDTRAFWAKRVTKAINLLTDYLKVSKDDITDILLKCLQNLKKLQQNLPPLPLPASEIPEVLVPPRQQDILVFVGEENLVEAFQNRGPDLDRVRNFFANHENRVIVVTGAIGIGKSAFTNWMFRKAFGDWDVIRVKIPGEASVSRVVADIGYQLGIPVDVDSLASASHKIFRQKIRKILAQFYSLRKRALVIDDLHEILRTRNARHHRQLATFIEEAAAPESYSGGRVFLVSSQWLPDKWMNTTGVSLLHLKGINDVYIQRIIEYHMRQANFIASEEPFEAPQSLLDIIKRHPLSATLVAEVLRDTDPRKLSDELTLRKVTGYVAQELLERVELSSIEQVIMKRISVFRLPIPIDAITSIEQFEIDEAHLLKLAERCILHYDGHAFILHEAVRRYFYSQMPQADMIKFHGLAALYYKKIHESQKTNGSKDPSIIGEMVHHLSLSGKLSEIKNLRLLVVEEIKPAARKIYQEQHNWPSALSLYRLLAEIVPDDTQVLAYIGRCYARLGQWNESDQAFERAIDMASRTGHPSWWIYRDWGHIRARYGFYVEAKDHFERASASNPNDPSIKSSLAYMYWKQGDDDTAYDFFEEAMRLEPYHEYTLTYYPKFLDSIGRNDYANSLRDRLNEIESGIRYIEPADYDIEFDYDDMTDVDV